MNQSLMVFACRQRLIKKPGRQTKKQQEIDNVQDIWHGHPFPCRNGVVLAGLARSLTQVTVLLLLSAAAGARVVAADAVPAVPNWLHLFGGAGPVGESRIGRSGRGRSWR